MSRIIAANSGERWLRRIGVAVLLVAVIATSLYFAVPTQAFDITHPYLPDTGVLGNPYNFSTKIDITDFELLPIQSVDLYIYNVADRTHYQVTCTELPLSSCCKSYTDIQTGGGPVDILATAGPGWTTSYGYGYATWQGYGYYFFPPGGYGYGYGSTASMTYNITWYAPITWPAGTYKVEVKLTADGQIFPKTSNAITLSGAPPALGPAPAPTVAQIEAMTPEQAAAAVTNMTVAQAAATIEQLSTAKASEIMTSISTDKAADIIETVTTTKAVELVQTLTTAKAASILQSVPATTGAAIIQDTATTKAVNIIQAMPSTSAGAIVQNLTVTKGTEIVQSVTPAQAAGVLSVVAPVQAAGIMEGLTTEKLTQTIPLMTEQSLIERLPGLTPDKLYSIQAQVLFNSMPNAPREQLCSEKPPQPPAGAAPPVVISTTPSGVSYMAIQTWAGEWVVVVATPPPLEKIMIKTAQAGTNVETTVEISDKLPSGVTVGLPTTQKVRAYANISFKNLSSDAIQLGYVAFKVEKSWLEQNLVHKWSVALNRYDPDLKQWIALPTKRVKEDSSFVYYTAVVTRFSVFAISGSQTLPALSFKVSSLIVSSASVKTGEPVTITADVTNQSGVAGTYAATLWINGTAEAGKNISLNPGETKPVSFNVTPKAEGTYQVRLDRFYGTFTAVKPAPTTPTPPVTPTPVPATFTVGNLSISPASVKPSEQVSISVLVSNNGDVSGTYKVSLKVDNVVVTSRDITLAGKTNQVVVFTTTKDAPGTYSVDVNGLASKFTVQAVVVPPPSGVSPWLIGGIIAAVITAAVAVFFVVRRERARRAS